MDRGLYIVLTGASSYGIMDIRMDIFVNITRNGVYNGLNVEHTEVYYKEHHNGVQIFYFGNLYL